METLIQNPSAWLPLACWTVAFSLMVWGTRLTLKLFNKAPPHLDAPFALYPVSILKPLKGADHALSDNLESFFQLRYPEYELLFSVEDERDPACAVVRSLMARYPRVNAQLIVAGIEIGPNPKVNNLAFSYGRARHDWILISDSNVRVGQDYLRRMVAHIDPSVGMITAIVAGREARGLGGHLEASYLNTFYARGMSMAEAAGRPCVIGKSMLFRRSVAARFGGMGTLARYLAEDYMAGEAMLRLGFRVILMSDPVDQIIGNHSLEAFWQRHLRWGRIRKAQAPLPFALEPLINPFVAGLFGAYAFNTWLGIPYSQFLLAHLALWSLGDFLLMRRLESGLHFKMAIAWFLRETLALPLWIHVACGNTVNWRGNQLAIQPGGTLETR